MPACLSVDTVGEIITKQLPAAIKVMQLSSHCNNAAHHLYIIILAEFYSHSQRIIVSVFRQGPMHMRHSTVYNQVPWQPGLFKPTLFMSR